MKRRRRSSKRKCLHCGEMYVPDPRTRDRQRHCSAPECRRASKAWRQRRWLSKAENHNYFRGFHQVERTRAWRRAHPGYWKRGPKPTNALQDDCLSQTLDTQRATYGLGLNALQDDCLLQPAVVVGLIAQLTGSVLQDDIAITVRRMHAFGERILGMEPRTPSEGDGDDHQMSIVPGAGAPSAGPVQLAGPSASARRSYQAVRS